MKILFTYLIFAFNFLMGYNIMVSREDRLLQIIAEYERNLELEQIRRDRTISANWFRALGAEDQRLMKQYIKIREEVWKKLT